MSKFQDPEYLCSDQYRTAEKLNARIRLHTGFSTNHYGWFKWVYDHYDLPPVCRILELGCGPGDLWLENTSRIPTGWEITLSDFSPGMLDKARSNLSEVSRPFDYRVIDAQDIPFGEGRFEAVIANHCLYHIPDRPKALSEIYRVLKPGGRFYATTIGAAHLYEMPGLAASFDPDLDDVFKHENNPFTLENGADQLRDWFTGIKTHRYPDTLHVTQAAPLVDFILSSIRFGMDQNHRPAFIDYIEAEIDVRGGVIRIQKDSGMFAAQNH